MYHEHDCSNFYKLYRPTENVGDNFLRLILLMILCYIDSFDDSLSG